MNTTEIVLLCLIGGLFVLAIIRAFLRKGKNCSCCNGDCSACRGDSSRKSDKKSS
ncbi:MAG: FeoB-associated Cys-rich membrane protein [Clostridiales bacterium]|nr:FeoB-associated Cys-rich membrane protein [Candidatus Coliplasma caballi]